MKVSKAVGTIIGKKINFNPENKIILGIDPGLQNLGIGIIEINLKNKYEIIKNKKKNILPISLLSLIENYNHLFLKIKQNRETSEKLYFIYETLCEIIEEIQPNLIILEDAFVGINKNSALKLGLARGSILAAIGKHKKNVIIISPKEIKMEVTMKGNSEKTEIEDFFKANFKNWESLEKLDSSDALAAAFCGIKHFL